MFDTFKVLCHERGISMSEVRLMAFNCDLGGSLRCSVSIVVSAVIVTMFRTTRCFGDHCAVPQHHQMSSATDVALWRFLGGGAKSES